MPTISHVEDKLAIRELIENWAVWRDSFQWESVGDIKPLLSRFPKGGWRTKAARTHSTSMVRGGHGRCQGWYPPGGCPSPKLHPVGKWLIYQF
jgi:hypothetical protein